MINLLDLGAIQLMALPIELLHVRDLEEFDGPLLSEFRSVKGEPFIYYWCDCDDEHNRWLVIRTPRQKLSQYLVGRSTLLDLIKDCQDQVVYVVDMNSAADVVGVWFMHVLSLPEKYFPGKRSYYTRRNMATEPGYQDAYINQKWNYPQVASYPKKYLQAYAFHSAFGLGGDPQSLTVDYSLTQGWIFHTLFNKLKVNAPESKQATLDEVAFASPGYLRFKVDSELAAGLRETIAKYIEQRHAISSLSNDLSDWANGHRTDVDDRGARVWILKLSEQVLVDGESLLRHAQTTQIAAKAIVSYIVRLKALAKNVLEGNVLLVGLDSGDGT